MRNSLLILMCLAALTLPAKVWQVGPNAFRSISEVLKKAAPFDTIKVGKGIYKEGNLVVYRPVVLIGENWPVLDGQKKYEVLSIRSNDVKVSGFKVQHSGFGTLEDPGAIKLYNTKRVEISDNILEDNFFGIYVQYGTHCIIKNNHITAYGTEEQQIGNGIHCWKSDSLQIIGNSVRGHRDGIYFEFVTHSIIWRNRSKANIRYGLHFMFSNNDAYIGNVFKENGAGVAVMFTKGVTMINNVFEENWGDASYGLLLKEISDSYIYGNQFIHNTAGVYMEGTNRIHFEYNQMEYNGWGMKMQANCMDNEVIKNNFVSNTFDVSTNGTLVLNHFDKNYWDKYEGYDLNRDGIGDIPYHPLSLFSVIVENYPSAMLLYRSFMVSLLDRSEKVMPTLTPDHFIDNQPVMHSVK